MSIPLPFLRAYLTVLPPYPLHSLWYFTVLKFVFLITLLLVLVLVLWLYLCKNHIIYGFILHIFYFFKNEKMDILQLVFWAWYYISKIHPCWMYTTRSFIFIITTFYLLTSIYSSFLFDGYLGYFLVLSLQIMLLWIFFWCLSAHLRDFLGCFISLNTVAKNRIYSIYRYYKV